ncbi:unnamed protein product, partial [Amoebophrya sp. A25]
GDATGVKACVRDFCQRQTYCGGYEVRLPSPRRKLSYGPTDEDSFGLSFRLLLAGGFEEDGDDQSHSLRSCGTHIGLPNSCPSHTRCYQLLRPRFAPRSLDVYRKHADALRRGTSVQDLERQYRDYQNSGGGSYQTPSAPQPGSTSTSVSGMLDWHERINYSPFSDIILPSYDVSRHVDPLMMLDQANNQMKIFGVVMAERTFANAVQDSLRAYVSRYPPVTAFSTPISVYTAGDIALFDFPEYHLHELSGAEPKMWKHDPNQRDLTGFHLSHLSLGYRPTYTLPTCAAPLPRGYLAGPGLVETATRSPSSVVQASDLVTFSGEAYASWSSAPTLDGLADYIPGIIRATLQNPVETNDAAFHQCMQGGSLGGHGGALPGTVCDLRCVGDYIPRLSADSGYQFASIRTARGLQVSLQQTKKEVSSASSVRKREDQELDKHQEKDARSTGKKWRSLSSDTCAATSSMMQMFVSTGLSAFVCVPPSSVYDVPVNGNCPTAETTPRPLVQQSSTRQPMGFHGLGCGPMTCPHIDDDELLNAYGARVASTWTSDTIFQMLTAELQQVNGDGGEEGEGTTTPNPDGKSSSLPPALDPFASSSPAPSRRTLYTRETRGAMAAVRAMMGDADTDAVGRNGKLKPAAGESPRWKRWKSRTGAREAKPRAKVESTSTSKSAARKLDHEGDGGSENYGSGISAGGSSKPWFLTGPPNTWVDANADASVIDPLLDGTSLVKPLQLQNIRYHFPSVFGSQNLPPVSSYDESGNLIDSATIPGSGGYDMPYGSSPAYNFITNSYTLPYNHRALSDAAGSPWPTLPTSTSLVYDEAVVPLGSQAPYPMGTLPGLGVTTHAAIIGCDLPSTQPANVFVEVRCIDGRWFPPWVRALQSGADGIDVSPETRRLQKAFRLKRASVASAPRRAGSETKTIFKIADDHAESKAVVKNAELATKSTSLKQVSAARKAVEKSRTTSGERRLKMEQRKKVLAKQRVLYMNKIQEKLQRTKGKRRRTTSMVEGDIPYPHTYNVDQEPQCFAALPCPLEAITSQRLEVYQQDHVTRYASTVTTVPSGTRVSVGCPTDVETTSTDPETGNVIMRDFFMLTTDAETTAVFNPELADSNDLGVRTSITTTTTTAAQAAAAVAALEAAEAAALAEGGQTTTTTPWPYPGMKISKVTRICYNGDWLDMAIAGTHLISQGGLFKRAMNGTEVYSAFYGSGARAGTAPAGALTSTVYPGYYYGFSILGGEGGAKGENVNVDISLPSEEALEAFDAAAAAMAAATAADDAVADGDDAQAVATAANEAAEVSSIAAAAVASAASGATSEGPQAVADAVNAVATQLEKTAMSYTSGLEGQFGEGSGEDGATTTTTTTTTPVLFVVREKSQFPACRKIPLPGENEPRTQTMSRVALQVSLAVDAGALASQAKRGTAENPAQAAIACPDVDTLEASARLIQAARTATDAEKETSVWILNNADQVAASLLTSVAGSETSSEESIFISTVSFGAAADVILSLNYAGGTGLAIRRRLDGSIYRLTEEEIEMEFGISPSSSRKENPFSHLPGLQEGDLKAANDNARLRSLMQTTVSSSQVSDVASYNQPRSSRGDTDAIGSGTASRGELQLAGGERKLQSSGVSGSVTVAYAFQYRVVTADPNTLATKIAAAESSVTSTTFSQRLSAATTSSFGCTVSCVTSAPVVQSYAIQESVTVEINEWKYRPWSVCDNGCGPGAQLREFFCDQSAEGGNLEPCPVEDIAKLLLKQSCLEWGACAASILCPLTEEYNCATQSLIILGVVGVCSLMFLNYMYRGCRVPRGGNVRGLALDKKGKMRWSKAKDKETGKQKITWNSDDIAAYLASKGSEITTGVVVDDDMKKPKGEGEADDSSSSFSSSSGDEENKEDGDDDVEKADSPRKSLGSKDDKQIVVTGAPVEINDVDLVADMTARRSSNRPDMGKFFRMASMAKVDFDDMSEVVELYPAPPPCFAIGEPVEYYSSTYSTFLPATMAAHNRFLNTCAVTLSARLSKQTRKNVPYIMIRCALREHERCEVFISDAVGWVGPVFVEKRITVRGRGAEYVVEAGELQGNFKLRTNKMRVEIAKIRRQFAVDDDVVVYYDDRWVEAKVLSVYAEQVGQHAAEAAEWLQRRIQLRAATAHGLSSGKKNEIRRKKARLSRENTNLFGFGGFSGDAGETPAREDDDDSPSQMQPVGEGAIVPVDKPAPQDSDSGSEPAISRENTKEISRENSFVTPRKKSKLSRRDSVEFLREEQSMLSSRQSQPMKTPRAKTEGENDSPRPGRQSKSVSPQKEGETPNPLLHSAASSHSIGSEKWKAARAVLQNIRTLRAEDVVQ